MKNNVPEGVSRKTETLFTGRVRDWHNAAVHLACLGYCEYYRGDDGEKGCSGLAVVRKGVMTGKIGLEQISHLINVPPGPARRSGCLINEMCFGCSYLKEGCDFMAVSPPPDATPCGGYRLIMALLEHGALTPAVVRELIQD